MRFISSSCRTSSGCADDRRLFRCSLLRRRVVLPAASRIPQMHQEIAEVSTLRGAWRGADRRWGTIQVDLQWFFVRVKIAVFGVSDGDGEAVLCSLGACVLCNDRGTWRRDLIQIEHWCTRRCVARAYRSLWGCPRCCGVDRCPLGRWPLGRWRRWCAVLHALLKQGQQM